MKKFMKSPILAVVAIAALLRVASTDFETLRVRFAFDSARLQQGTAASHEMSEDTETAGPVPNVRVQKPSATRAGRQVPCETESPRVRPSGCGTR